MSNGFIKLPRDLLKNAIWKSLSFEYRHIFLTILENAAYAPITLNDHGKLINLEPGQMMTTVRELAKLCDEDTIDKSKVERALKRFFELGFSIQETRHTKTIITITQPSVCELIKLQNETRNETTSRQDRDIKEEIQERKKYNVRGVLLSEDKTQILGLEEKYMIEFDSICKANGFNTLEVLTYCLEKVNAKYKEGDLGSAIKFMNGIAEKYNPKETLKKVNFTPIAYNIPSVSDMEEDEKFEQERLKQQEEHERRRRMESNYIYGS